MYIQESFIVEACLQRFVSAFGVNCSTYICISVASFPHLYIFRSYPSILLMWVSICQVCLKRPSSYRQNCINYRSSMAVNSWCHLCIVHTSYTCIRPMLLIITLWLLPFVGYGLIKISAISMLPHRHYDIKSGPALEGIMHGVKFLGDTGLYIDSPYVVSIPAIF